MPAEATRSTLCSRLLLTGCVALGLSAGPALAAPQGQAEQEPTLQYPPPLEDRDPAAERAESGFPAQQDALENREAPDPIQRGPVPYDPHTEAEEAEDFLLGYLGAPVVNPAGEPLGELQGIARDAGEELHVVIRTGDLPGIGARQVALPADEFLFGAGELMSREHIALAELAQAPPYLAEDYELVAADPQRPLADEG